MVTQTTEVAARLKHDNEMLNFVRRFFFSLFIYKPKLVPEVNTYGRVRNKNTVFKSRFAIRIFSSLWKLAFKE